MEKTLTSSVIICTRNRLHDTLSCLKSLAVQTYMPEELIIVDSSDVPLREQDEFTQYFTQTTFPKMALQYVHTKPGLTYQRNIGVARACGDMIHFLDDDVVLEPQYLQSMVDVAARHPHYGGGMGTVVNITPKRIFLHRAFKAFFMLQRSYSSGRFTWSGMPTHAYGNQKIQNVEVLGGCCMSFKKEFLLKHRFDEQLVRYCFMEDCDISRRVSLEAPLFYNPQARLCHYNSPLSRDGVIDNRAMYAKNYSYLFFKNFYPQNKLRVLGYLWSIAGLFIEALLTGHINHIRGYYRGLKEFYGRS